MTPLQSLVDIVSSRTAKLREKGMGGREGAREGGRKGVGDGGREK